VTGGADVEGDVEAGPGPEVDWECVVYGEHGARAFTTSPPYLEAVVTSEVALPPQELEDRALAALTRKIEVFGRVQLRRQFKQQLRDDWAEMQKRFEELTAMVREPFDDEQFIRERVQTPAPPEPERCKHDMLPGTCDWCAPRPSAVPEVVQVDYWFTAKCPGQCAGPCGEWFGTGDEIGAADGEYFCGRCGR
jgi:hypothetical protein